MRACKVCGRVRFHSLNFIFSESVCNECHMLEKEYEGRREAKNSS